MKMMPGPYKVVMRSDLTFQTLSLKEYGPAADVAHDFVELFPGNKVYVGVFGSQGKIWSYELNKEQHK